MYFHFHPNQKSNKKVKNLKKWQRKSTLPIVFSFSSGSLVHFSRKRSPVHFLTKTLDSIPVLIQKPKEKREREKEEEEEEEGEGERD